MMKRRIAALLLIFVSAAQAAEKVYFPEIREKAAKVGKLSPEDFRLGRELMKEVRKLAAGKKPAVPAGFFSCRG